MADQKLSALTTAGQLSSTDLFLVAQGIGSTPVSRKLPLSALREVFNVKDYGAVGDYSTDDTVAIQAAMDAAVTAGAYEGSDQYDGVVFFPMGVYRTSVPLRIRGGIRMTGAGSHASIIRATNTPGFTGYYVLCNWEANDATPPGTDSNPTGLVGQIDNLGLGVGSNTGLNCFGFWNWHEQCWVEDVSCYSNSDATGTVGIRLPGAHNNGRLRNLCFFGGGSAGWKTDIWAGEVSGGASLEIQNVTSSGATTTASPFIFNAIHNVVMRNCNIEAQPGTVANSAIIHVTDCHGFSLLDSLISIHAETSRPLIKTVNSNTSGYDVLPPVLRNIAHPSNDYFTGNLIEDASQSGNAYNVDAGDHQMIYLDLYDGRDLKYRADDNVGTPKHYKLRAGSIFRDSHAAAAPVSGTYVVGDTVWNTAPAAAGYMGWVCTTGGTPGTWKGFGVIAS